MQNRLFRTLALLLCMIAMVLGSVLSASATESEIIITHEKEVDVHISEENSSYVYLDAEAPLEWLGTIQVTFHSLNNGKNYTASLSYMENEYRSGIWLPFGRYTVSPTILDDDGMCLVDLKDPDQEKITIVKGEDIELSIVATENPDYEFVIPPRDDSFIAPLPKEEYNDLPTLGAATDENLTENTECTEAEITVDIQNNPAHSIVWGIVISVVLFGTISVVGVIIFRKRRYE